MEKAAKPARPGWRAALAVGAVLIAGIVAAYLFVYLRARADNSIEGLIRRMGDHHSADAVDAHEILERRVGTNNLDFWKRALETTENPDARVKIVESIAKNRTPAAVQLLGGLLTDYASEVRRSAIEALSSTDRKSALPPLLVALKDEDTWVRESASMQLRFMNDKRAVPALMEALRDPERTVSAQAMINLRKLTGKKWHVRYTEGAEKYQAAVRQWEDWWKTARNSWPSDLALSRLQPIHPTRRAPAPGFDTPNVRGGRVRLTDLKGKIVLLNFWGTWCPPCQAEVPALQEVHTRFAAQGVEVVGVGVAEKSAEEVRRYAERRRITYTLALATDAILEDYGHIHEVPISFLIDRRGQIRYRWDGDRDFPTFSAAAARLLREPDTP